MVIGFVFNWIFSALICMQLLVRKERRFCKTNVLYANDLINTERKWTRSLTH